MLFRSLLGQLGLACRDRVGDRRAGLVAAPLLGGVEFFELGRVGDSLHRGDHLIGRLFQLGGQLVLAVAAFLRIRRRTIFRSSGAASARDRGGIPVAARGSAAGRTAAPSVGKEVVGTCIYREWPYN